MFSSLKHIDYIIEKGSQFVSDYPEIVKTANKLASYNDEPKLYRYAINFKDKFDSENSEEAGAAGISFNKKRALLKVLGETVERYSLSGNNNKKFIKESYENLDNLHKSIISLEEITSFSKGKSQIEKLKKTKINWVKGKSLISDENVLIPAQLIYVPYVYQYSEPTLRFLISTGAAAGSSLEGALYRGICEVIERDAFMIHYLNKLSSPRIDLSSIGSGVINNILRSLKRYKLEINVFDLTTDLQVPVFAAITIDRTGFGSSISVGLKAGFDIEEDIIGAIEESLMVRSWVRDKFIYMDPNYKRTGKIVSVEDRAHFWFPVTAMKHIDFWLKSKNFKKIDISHKKNSDINDLKKIIKFLMKKNIEAFYVNIADKKVTKYGFSVIKAVIPKLQPLYLDERDSYLKSERLFNVPIRMGFLQTPRRKEQLNKIPHPFL